MAVEMMGRHSAATWRIHAEIDPEMAE